MTATSERAGIVVVDHHPIQYHAPVFRCVQQRFNIPVTAVYATDFSVSGGLDHEFGAHISWDNDVLSGYRSIFLAKTMGPRSSTLRGVMQSVSPNVFLILGYGSMFDRLAIISALRSGRPILFRGETTDHARKRGRLKNVVRDSALRWFYRRCAKLLYIGQRSRAHYCRLGSPDSKLVFSPYCVDTAPFSCDIASQSALRTQTRELLGVSRSQTILLFSGKLSHRKGPDLLLRAFSGLSATNRERAIVVFMGSGEMTTLLRTQAEQLGLSSRVRFVGFQNQTKLSQYYLAADLLVVPSRHSETWGLVVNEALHHGLPCVVSDAVGSAPDLIHSGKSGETCTPDSVVSLAAAIERLLPIVGLPQTREVCRRIASAYTVDAAAAGIASAYYDAMSETPEARLESGLGNGHCQEANDRWESRSGSCRSTPTVRS